eukprot:tig00000889_g5300.t1
MPASKLKTIPAPAYDRVWTEERSTSCRMKVSVWQPRCPPGSNYRWLGHIAVADNEEHSAAPPRAVLVEDEGDGTLALPLGFDLVWTSKGSRAEEASVWAPRAPKGYASLGHVLVRGFDPPSLALGVRCVALGALQSGNFTEMLWKDSGSGASLDVSFWGVTGPHGPNGAPFSGPDPQTFIAVGNYNQPAPSLALALAC